MCDSYVDCCGVSGIDAKIYPVLRATRGTEEHVSCRYSLMRCMQGVAELLEQESVSFYAL